MTAAARDTITLNGSTTGGLLQSLAKQSVQTDGAYKSTLGGCGDAATPFSAA